MNSKKCLLLFFSFICFGSTKSVAGPICNQDTASIKIHVEVSSASMWFKPYSITVYKQQDTIKIVYKFQDTIKYKLLYNDKEYLMPIRR